MGIWMESDIEALLAGVGGAAIVHGSETGRGVVDTPDAQQLMGMDSSISVPTTVVHVRSAAFPTLKIGDTITIDGSNYHVTDQQRLADGGLKKLLCRPGS